MPQIKLKHIVSFSSEDPAHPADNLLKAETYRKWQCAVPEEKQTSVVIELEKASKIHSVDIGNNGSAFVEVLAGRSSSDQFQVLLVASSFMSPAESKSGLNSNRVRIFGPEKLSKATAEQKWDRIKFVCTQPYNKTSCYGLSFINLHSPPDNTDNPQEKGKTQTKLGAFLLKDEAVDTISAGSLFAKRKENLAAPSMSIAAELKEASKKPEVSSMRSTSSPGLSKRESKQEIEQEKKNSTVSLSFKRKTEDIPSKDMNVAKTSSKEREVVPPTKKVKVSETNEREVPLNEILKEVVFVLSGFKNPDRGELRDKALAMGAHYRGDWDKTCTHLVCAFVNTPKYNQVKAAGRGKIVNKKWIHDCHKRRKRISEGRYKLRGESSDESDSDNTEDENSYQVKASTSREPPKDAIDSNANTSRAAEELDESANDDKTLPISDEKFSDDGFSSDHDTEDEIRRVMNEEEDPYGGSTECDSDNEDEDKTSRSQKDKSATTVSASSSTNLLILPDFFSKAIFFLYGKFETGERRTLTRYITAYDGELEEYMNDNVKYVITNEDWDDNFNEALVDNSSLTFVRPKWIYMCHEKRSFVPYQPYIVVPR